MFLKKPTDFVLFLSFPPLILALKGSEMAEKLASEQENKVQGELKIG